MSILSDELRKLSVWQKGRVIPGRDPAECRLDALGGFMVYGEYGLTTAYGWEIDHIDPNGSDELVALAVGIDVAKAD